MRTYKNNKGAQELEDPNVSITVQDQRWVVYWQVQAETVQALHLVGIHFNVNDRVPVFKVYAELEKRRKNIDKYGYPEHELIEVESHLARLVKYRQAGYEPPNAEEKYK